MITFSGGGMGFNPTPRKKTASSALEEFLPQWHNKQYCVQTNEQYNQLLFHVTQCVMKPTIAQFCGIDSPASSRCENSHVRIYHRHRM